MMALDKDKQESIRRQNQLIAEKQLHYRTGNLKEVEKIERRLEPDKEVVVKHPWA